MTIGEMINNVAIKAGVDPADIKLKSLLASTELATLTVDDALAALIDNGLLNIEAAKNNHPDIKRKYFADAYDGMDKQLLSLVASDTFDQADLDEIKAEKSTSKKQELIITKLKAAKSQASGADKDAINAQLKAAHESARLAKLEVDSVTSSYENKIKDIEKKAAIKAVFGNYKTIYDDLPANVKLATMEAIINQGLQDKNAELKTDEHGNLLLLSKDGSSNVFGDNHVQLTPSSFLDKTFAPILKQSGPPKPVATPRQNVPITPSKSDIDTEASVSFVKSHTEQMIADMAKPSASMM